MSKQVIKLTKKDIHNIIKECISNYAQYQSLLTEDRESKNMKKARNVVRQFNPNADAMQIITAIRNDIHNSRINQCEYLPGVTRMYMNNEIKDGETISKLDSSLEILGSSHSNEYDNDLNGMSARELINKFNAEIKAELDSKVQASKNMQLTENKNYKIYRIESFEDASKFEDYTAWCITHDDESYQAYTHNGLGLFYFCIRNDYKRVPKEKSEGYPLDSYGTSMIATSVDVNGKCNTITCRWNDQGSVNDHIMTPEELSKLIGKNYYDTFKPYTEEELRTKGKISLGRAEELLQQGEDPKEIFNHVDICSSNGFLIVELNRLKNIINPQTNKLLLKDWAESIDDFEDGFATVKLKNYKGNYVREDGTFLFDNWVNARLYEFKYGYAYYGQPSSIHYTYEDYYIINTKGEILNKKPIIGNNLRLVKNLVCVSLSYNKHKLFYYDGTPFLNDETYDHVEICDNGLLKIVLNRLKNILNPQTGEFLLKDWVDKIGEFKDGIATVISEDNKSNYVREDGTFLFDNWVKAHLYEFKYGHAYYCQPSSIHYTYEDYYIINTKGEILNKEPICAIRLIMLKKFIIVVFPLRKSLLYFDGTPVIDEDIYGYDDIWNGSVIIRTESDKLGFILPNGQLFKNKFWEEINNPDDGHYIFKDYDGKEYKFNI